MLKIRRYRPEDKNAVKELHLDGIKQMYETVPGVPRPDIPGLDDDLDDIEGVYLKNNGEFLVGLESDEIVTIGAIMKFTDTCAEVRRVRVRRDYQGKGYAKKMMSKLLEAAQRLGYKELTLDTMIKNTAAQRLFEKFGFTQTRPGNYKHIEVIYYGKKLGS